MAGASATGEDIFKLGGLGVHDLNSTCSISCIANLGYFQEDMRVFLSVGTPTSAIIHAHKWTVCTNNLQHY